DTYTWRKGKQRRKGHNVHQQEHNALHQYVGIAGFGQVILRKIGVHTFAERREKQVFVFVNEFYFAFKLHLIYLIFLILNSFGGSVFYESVGYVFASCRSSLCFWMQKCFRRQTCTNWRLQI